MSSKEEVMALFVTAAEAAEKIKDGATVGVAGMGIVRMAGGGRGGGRRAF